MSATIKVKLSEAGRKAQVLAGADPARVRDIRVSRESPEFPAVVELGTVGDDGVVWRTDCYGDPDWDHLPTAAEVVAEYRGRKAKEAEEERRRAEQRKADTLAVLTERRAKESRQYSPIDHTALVPDWPYNSDPEVTASPEALAWLAELEAENAKRRECVAAAAEEVARLKEVARQRAEQREAERRAELGLKDGEIDLTVEDGALTEVPAGCWESHRRGKNWLAVISADPSSPGGLSRSFQVKARGDSYYLTSGLSVGDAVEFGADYYSGGGRNNARRWYGVVTRVTESLVVLEPAKTGKAACKRAKEFPSEVAS